MNKRDIVKVKLTKDELDKIKTYCDKIFPKDEIMKKEYQWKSQSNRNPNETGITGEWAYFKMFSKAGLTLDEYLKNRPQYRMDHGDGILDSGQNIDIKTRYFDDAMEELWDKNYYTGRVEEKHIDKDYIDIFIFVHILPEEEIAYIIGWMERDEFFINARLVKNKYGEVTYGRPNTNWYELEYSKMYSISSLRNNKVCMFEE